MNVIVNLWNRRFSNQATNKKRTSISALVLKSYRHLWYSINWNLSLFLFCSLTFPYMQWKINTNVCWQFAFYNIIIGSVNRIKNADSIVERKISLKIQLNLKWDRSDFYHNLSLPVSLAVTWITRNKARTAPISSHRVAPRAIKAVIVWTCSLKEEKRSELH